MPCLRYIDTATKNQILGALEAELMVKDVIQRFQVSKQTIWRLRKQMESEGNVKNRAKSGRPRKTTENQDRAMVRHNKKDPNRSATDSIAYANEVLGVQISKRTAQRRLKRAGLFARRPAKKPLFKKKHRKARLEFVRSHEHWTKEDWSRILWSDETKFNLFNPDGRPIRMRYKPRYVRPTVKFGGGSLMA
uniref:Transposase Tc1-like domain-containing protein n=1 Tax=Acrobeloides nanus TaxID=290746 RepID=A0A914E9J0_9BILA